MAKLEKGMYVKLLKNVMIYDPHTYAPINIAEGSHGEIEYVSTPFVSVKFAAGPVPVMLSDKDINKSFEVL